MDQKRPVPGQGRSERKSLSAFPLVRERWRQLDSAGIAAAELEHTAFVVVAAAVEHTASAVAAGIDAVRIVAAVAVDTAAGVAAD